MLTYRRRTSGAAFAAAAVFAAAAGLALAGAHPACAQIDLGGDGPANPFANLKNATKEVSSYAKANPDAPIDLRSPDVNTTLDRLNTLLVLTPEERSQIGKRLETRNSAVRATLKDKSLGEQAQEDRLEGIQRDTEIAVVSYLTPEQQVKLKVELGQRRASDTVACRMNRLFSVDYREASLATPRAAVDQWASTLQLTPDQARALLPIVENEFKNLDAVAADRGLSSDESHWRTMAAMVAAERQINTLLTPQQATHFDGMINMLPTTTADNPRTGHAGVQEAQAR